MNISASRRNFLSCSLYSGVLIFATPIAFASNGNPEEKPEGELTPLIKIHSDNRITFFYPSPEMGQGTDTSLAMLFIEELGGDMDLVSVEPLPYLLKREADGKIAAMAVPQFSGGSTSISRNWSLLREAGASARQLLLLAAARYFDKPTSALSVRDSHVFDKSGRSIPFGGLVELAAGETLPNGFTPTLKPHKQWQTIGKKQPSKQVADIVTGQPLYGMDMDYPDAKVALIARCPYLDGDVASFDAKAAEALDGVHAIVQLKRPDLTKYYTYLAAGVAVIADDFWTAKKARDLLKITWHKGPYVNESTELLNQQCQKLLEGKGQIVRDDGQYQAALESAEKVITHTYQLPLISHAQLEPQNCIAHVTKDNCTIIGPFQSPGGASRLAEQITGFDRVKMDIRYTRLGGGFGRRLNSDHAAEAVLISKHSGLPIKLIWTREDDMCHDFYRPMGVHQLTAGVDKNGKMIAWSHRLAGTPKHYRRNSVKPEELYGADMYIDDFPAELVENLQYEYLLASSGTPQGSWRAPAHTANAFVVQSFLNEVAAETKQDPLDLRLSMLGDPRQLKYDQHGGPIFDTGRMANVLKQAAKLAKWGKTMPEGRALGIAGHFTFGGYCAHVADVEVKPDKAIKVHQVWAAIDVGIVVNPEGVIAQVEGGINDGLSTALGQQIIVHDAQVTTDNFDSYPMTRIGDSVTRIEVEIIDSEEDPSGVGEMGLPPLAPAVANAIVAAGGPRLRAQPFYINGKLRS